MEEVSNSQVGRNGPAVFDEVLYGRVLTHSRLEYQQIVHGFAHFRAAKKLSQATIATALDIAPARISEFERLESTGVSLMRCLMFLECVDHTLDVVPSRAPQDRSVAPKAEGLMHTIEKRQNRRSEAEVASVHAGALAQGYAPRIAPAAGVRPGLPTAAVLVSLLAAKANEFNEDFYHAVYQAAKLRYQHLVHEIASMRSYRKLKQTDVAELLEISPQRISEFENLDHSEVSLLRVLQFAEVTGLTLEVVPSERISSHLPTVIKDPSTRGQMAATSAVNDSPIRARVAKDSKRSPQEHS